MKLYNYIMFAISLIQFALSLYAFNNNENNILFYNLIFFWIMFFVYAYKGGIYSLILLFFLSTFFVFLLGRDLVVNLFPSYQFISKDFSCETLSHIYYSMHLSLFFVYMGYLFYDKRKRFLYINNDNLKNILIASFTKKIFYYTLPFKAIQIFIMAYNTLKYSYIDLYANKLSSIYLIDRLSQINYICFILFLMTYPSKKDLLPLLKVCIPIYSLSILGGARGDMMYFLLFVLAYLMFRDFLSKKNNILDEIFISKKTKIFLLFLMPFLIVFLLFFSFIRSDTEIESNGFLYDLLSFFVQQGGSYSLIGYVYEYASLLPQSNISYTFGPLLQFVESFYTPNNLDFLTYDALYGNNLGATITYLVEPFYYYIGGGYGTQYIAELYADFGYIGIALFSFILGVLLVMFRFFSHKNVYLNALFAFALITVFSMPRNYYFSWILSFLSFFNILFILILNAYVNTKLKANN